MESCQKGAKRSAFQTIGCILLKKIVWNQIKQTSKYKECGVNHSTYNCDLKIETLKKSVYTCNS